MSEWHLIKQKSSYVLDTGLIELPCLVGRSGLIDGDKKQEGDGATPKGRWPLRCLYFRPDKISTKALPRSFALACQPITPDDGWCDDPSSPLYNQLIQLPCNVRHEKLWRDDGLYDLVLPMGYNDQPALPHKGSAIFLHCAAENTRHTQGCLALAKPDLLMALNHITAATYIVI